MCSVINNIKESNELDLDNVEEFVINHEIKNKYELACDEITRIKVTRYQVKKQQRFEVLAEQMTNDMTDFDFIDKFSTTDMIHKRKINFNNKLFDSLVETPLTELQKDIEVYYEHCTKTNDFLNKHKYFKTGVNTCDSIQVEHLLDENSYTTYLRIMNCMIMFRLFFVFKYILM